ncbi:hypothetical protein [Hyphomicrobium facile]|uniref:Alpha/beta hydrolase family protein n=1 Tax=Hyphomicrobium facile TaxID=51670 RepID=A0A1I7NWW3_9HYPH|nr:hypothetical protein [Hyphomicrobium facile]SFV39141.1 hypothetical protein SAMN04488557_4167 [Hyphomicrobium facile]
MATIIAVHGTFAAPTAAGPDDAPPPELQWWEKGSVFENDMRALIDARDGQLNFLPFPWAGDNSEMKRRDAGERLTKTMRELEAKSEPYCIVGHSHGGSILSDALLDNAARKRPLANLKRWITVGTPFLKLRRELWLLTRLSLMRKVIFVASMMLLLMFIVYVLATQLGGDQTIFGRTFPRVWVATGVLASLPALTFYLALRWLDSRSLLNYHSRITRRAKNSFGSRWLPLSHPEDEAIQGLALLPDARLNFFDKSFAVSSITLLSVITLPVMYFVILLSPPAMVGIAEWLKTEIYDANASPEAEAALSALRQQLMVAHKGDGEAITTESGAEVQTPVDRQAAWRQYRERREQLETQYPNLDAIERGMRFKRRFFESRGRPCDGGTLCGGGRDIATNSGLLLHVVTDELSWALGAADLQDRRKRWFWSLFVPAIIVPAILGVVALLLMVVIQAFATFISAVASMFLNRITNAEVKRAAYGNDTEGEIAIGALDRPMWLEKSLPRLPSTIADLITDYSNAAASQSIAKFRRAIGQIRFAVPSHTADTAISTYFTWKELVHASYFDVPEFRKLIAQTISRAEGFAPSERFKADPDFERTARWLDEIENAPGTTDEPADREPGPKDSKAVAAVVGSTVKASP